ncbi:hypothetical protein WA171_001361, partial [Blastocystis sp. BT1]
MDSEGNQILQLSPDKVLELKLESGSSSTGIIHATNVSGKIMVIKMKSNAGKHIIANPSLFVLGSNDTRDIEVSIRSANVDTLISIAKNMKRKEEHFKLQFNILEISQLFFDKVKDAPEAELMDLLNKRWNMEEKGSIKQLLLSVRLIYPKFNDDPSNLASVPNQPAESAADTPTSAQYFSLEDEFKKLTIAHTKLKEFADELLKKYQVSQKQLEILHTDTHLSNDESDHLHDSKTVLKDPLPLYTGITMFQLLVGMVIAFVFGIWIAKKYW